jgi:hypothetical protein
MRRVMSSVARRRSAAFRTESGTGLPEVEAGSRWRRER